MRLHLCVLSIATLLIGMCHSAKCEIVFDTITNPEDYRGAVVFGAGDQAGDIVQLGGTSRVATELSVALWKARGINDPVTFRVNLWDSNGLPGNLLWASEVRQVSLQSGVPNVMTFQVPRIEVPSTLGWTVECMADTKSVEVVYATPSAAGRKLGSLIYDHALGWLFISSSQSSVGGEGFRLVADVPEPTTVVLLVGLALALTPRRSRLLQGYLSCQISSRCDTCAATIYQFSYGQSHQMPQE
jgi:hypothetical protein